MSFTCKTSGNKPKRETMKTVAIYYNLRYICLSSIQMWSNLSTNLCVKNKQIFARRYFMADIKWKERARGRKGVERRSSMREWASEMTKMKDKIIIDTCMYTMNKYHEIGLYMSLRRMPEISERTCEFRYKFTRYISSVYNRIDCGLLPNAFLSYDSSHNDFEINACFYMLQFLKHYGITNFCFSEERCWYFVLNFRTSTLSHMYILIR